MQKVYFGLSHCYQGRSKLLFLEGNFRYAHNNMGVFLDPNLGLAAENGKLHTIAITPSYPVQVYSSQHRGFAIFKSSCHFSLVYHVPEDFTSALLKLKIKQVSCEMVNNLVVFGLTQPESNRCLCFSSRCSDALVQSGSLALAQ